MRVFDASAVLAAIFEEPGSDRVTDLWADGENLLCTVNYAEVISKLAERGMTDAEVRVVMEGVPLKFVEFDQKTACAAGLLRRSTQVLGLSLGDRACLALAQHCDAQVVTADRLWKKHKGVEVVLIR